MANKPLNVDDAGYFQKIDNNHLHFSFFPDFRTNLESRSSILPETPSNKPSFRVHSVSELRSGDVVLSDQILREISLLQSYQELYLPSKSWILAKMLVSLMSYLEAYITQKRVLFLVEDNNLTIQKIEAEQFLDFDINLLKVPNLWNPESHKNILTKEDAILFQAYSSYLKSFGSAKDEYDRTSRATVDALKKTINPDIEVTGDDWDKIVFNEAIDLAVVQAWARHLNISLWASPLESPFCSPRLLSHLVSGDVAQSALRVVEKSRFNHAKENNELLRHQVYDYEVPFILGSILRHSKKWQDLFVVARQMRETKEAKAFRDWAGFLDSDLVSFHRHFQDIKGLASELAKGIDAREKRTIRLEFGQRRLLELPLPMPPRRDNKDLHLVFLQNLFDLNRSIIRVDHEFRRVLYAENSHIELAKKMRQWCKECEVVIDKEKNIIEVKPFRSIPESGEMPLNEIENPDSIKYETHIYGPVNAPVHTGSGDIQISDPNVDMGKSS